MAFALNQFFSANPVDESDDSPMITAVNYNLARSSSRLGHGPLKAGARVRVPYALPVRPAQVRVACFPSETASRADRTVVEGLSKNAKTERGACHK